MRRVVVPSCWLGALLAASAALGQTVPPAEPVQPSESAPAPSGLSRLGQWLTPPAQPGGTVVAYYPQLGFVRGSPDILATLSAPLPSQPGAPPEVVEACRTAIQGAARTYGATKVEAAGAGRAKRIRGGGWEAPVTVRILYARQLAYEVKQTTLTCKTDAEGRVTAAAT